MRFVVPLLDAVDRLLAAVLRAGRWLALPLAALLLAPWPLRDAVQAGSREANDVAQLLFAWYVSLAVTAATRAHAHLVVDILAARRPPRVRAQLARAASAVVVVPWSLALLALAWPPAARSIAVLESFPETFNPGYFLLKTALLALALAMLLQALLDVLRPRAGPAS